MDSEEHRTERIYSVVGVNTLSGAKVPTKVVAISTVKGLECPTIEGIRIGAWDAGWGVPLGKTALYFKPATLRGRPDAEVNLSFRCQLSVGGGRGMSAADGIDKLSDLGAVGQRFDIKSEADASSYAEVNSLSVEVALYEANE